MDPETVKTFLSGSLSSLEAVCSFAEEHAATIREMVNINTEALTRIEKGEAPDIVFAEIRERLVDLAKQ